MYALLQGYILLIIMLRIKYGTFQPASDYATLGSTVNATSSCTFDSFAIVNILVFAADLITNINSSSPKEAGVDMD